MTTTWQELATELATSVQGPVSPRWRDAIAATPRHALVPAFKTGRDEAVDLVRDAYRDMMLFPAVQPLPNALVHIRAPSVVAGVLEDLDIQPGQRVLEIGLEHGYSTALLTRVLGDDATFAVDSEPAAVEDVRARLADIGHRPHLAVGDRLPAHGPYDRILLTDEVTHVPWDLAEQLVPGGLISVDVSFGRSAGGRVVLRREADRLVGHFFPFGWATIPSSRRVMALPGRVGETYDRATADESITTLDPEQLWGPGVLWLMFLTTIGRRELTVGMTPYPDGDRYFITDHNGSWVEIERVEQERRRMRETRPHVVEPDPDIPPYTGPRQVWQAGPTRLWTNLARMHQTWTDLGQPKLEDLRLTVTPGRQWIWFDGPGRDWQADL
ncbi:MAG TPA: hypothetical protein VH352_17465 [Pseudonocardiaceae bacterium]|jgi:protein-L-isoaspartate O-methyltransferase|nr:hypothetical protein [Pseudonocardiaceae bacterium]